MQEIAKAYGSIPEDHVAMLIGLTAVVGGLILGAIAIGRGLSLHARIVELRSQLILELFNKGLTSKEVLAILDHPMMTTMTTSQMKHSKAVLAMLDQEPSVRNGPANEMFEKPDLAKKF